MEGLDASSIVPLYKQLKDLILKEIKEGKLKPNQKIPTEQELSENYQISRMTVRKALAQLVDEEVLAKKQGKGTFVQEPKIVEDLDNANSFTNLCKRNGKVPGGKTLKFVLEEPSDRDIRELQLEPKEQVIHIQRVRTADNIPVMLENLYFPGHLKDILTENLDDSSLYQILQEKLKAESGKLSDELEFARRSVNQYLEGVLGKEEINFAKLPMEEAIAAIKELIGLDQEEMDA